MVGMIESVPTSLGVRGLEAGLGTGERLGADGSAGDTSADGGDGGAERHPSGRSRGDDGRHGRHGRGDASQEGALTRLLGSLLGSLLDRLLDRLIGVGGVGGVGGGGLRHLRQCRREAAPHGGGSGLRCRWLGGRRHRGDVKDNARGAQQRAGFDGWVVPAANGPPEEGLGCSVGPLEGAAARLLVEQSLHETPGLPGVDVRRLGAEHRPEGVNDALKCDRLGGGGLHRWGRCPRWGGGRRCGHVELLPSSWGRLRPRWTIPPLTVLGQQRRLTDDLLLSASRCCCQNPVASNFLIFLLNQSLLLILRELRSESLDNASSAARCLRSSQKTCRARHAKLRQYIEIA